jgi:hypothetical protein
MGVNLEKQNFLFVNYRMNFTLDLITFHDYGSHQTIPWAESIPEYFVKYEVYILDEG